MRRKIKMTIKKENNTKIKKGTLNKFEFTRLLSARASELEAGAKPKISMAIITDKLKLIKGKILSQDYVKIAKEEFYQNKIELEIKK
jgi:DNA-directed RNA polymerase subunit K/omega